MGTLGYFSGESNKYFENYSMFTIGNRNFIILDLPI